jgi:hypothetical protein
MSPINVGNTNESNDGVLHYGVYTANEPPPSKQPKEQCLIRVIGHGTYLYERHPMRNDQFNVGDVYIVPIGKFAGKNQMLRARCLDWFQAPGPDLTIFIFEATK